MISSFSGGFGAFNAGADIEVFLEVLPYVLSALIAAVVVPGFLYSQAPGTKAAVAASAGGRGEYVLGIIREDHAAFAPEAVRSTAPPWRPETKPVSH
jgi:hypothetical protein